jgi:glutaminyl-peptide cyclotransferase
MNLRRCAALLALCLSGFVSLARAADTYKIVHSYPHDPQAYTQGLVFFDGHLYESTGLNGRSTLRMVDLTTGRVLQSVPVPGQYFAEGLASWGSTLIQLTWQSHVAFVYDLFSFRLLRTVPYDGEGWGLTEDGQHLILSDGSATLKFLDPPNFHVVRTIQVTDQGVPVTQLNELEYVRGEIYANVWHSDRIARISPATGKVLGWIDLAGILPADQRTDPEAVLNGIAYDAAHNRLFVTGKLWPRLFEIQVVPEAAKPVRARIAPMKPVAAPPVPAAQAR